MKQNNSSNSQNAHPVIVDPPPRPALPTMHTVQDAIDVCEREKSNFFLSAFMFQGCVYQLNLDCVAQLVERSDPARCCFQTGQARQAFAKLIVHHRRFHPYQNIRPPPPTNAIRKKPKPIASV
jgi:hypothetical protein